MSEELVNHYKADEREVGFLLFEQFRLQDLLGRGPYADFTEADARLIISEGLKFAIHEVGPLNGYADRLGCVYDPKSGAVTVPPLLKDLQRKYVENGWHGLRAPAVYGGQGAPYSLALAVSEFFAGACSAWAMYNGLTHGAAHLIEVFGTEEQKSLFCPKLYGGEWMGTMCLTEPGAGSEVGRSQTRAAPQPDGTHLIQGVKCFISGGEHDFTDNIVHMALARIEGAPGGTKGLSLFIIPKRRIRPDGTLGEPNDVRCRGIEKKMGINASATATLNFGDEDRCQGLLLGREENKGIAQMFQMMNEARIGTGLQALATASSAYLNALAYARQRVQGKRFEDIASGRRGASVRIIEHEDVRRMLVEMRSKVEGGRALALKLAIHLDRARTVEDAAGGADLARVDLLTPLVKAYLSDQAFRVAELAIQTYGGYGYIRDYPVEQYCRDIKIQSLYEGTNYIQALDLVGRKLNQDGGEPLRRLLTEIEAFATRLKEHPALGGESARLGEASAAVGRFALQYLEFMRSGRIRQIPLTATRFLEALAETVIGWLLLEGATVAHEALAAQAEGSREFHFYAGKLHVARFFARNVLPGAAFKARLAAEADTSALDIAEEQFPLDGLD